MWVIFSPTRGFYAGECAVPQFTKAATCGFTDPKQANERLTLLHERGFKDALVVSPGALLHMSLHPGWIPPVGW